jgi:hypothetical protein
VTTATLTDADVRVRRGPEAARLGRLTVDGEVPRVKVTRHAKSRRVMVIAIALSGWLGLSSASPQTRGTARRQVFAVMGTRPIAVDSTEAAGTDASRLDQRMSPVS